METRNINRIMIALVVSILLASVPLYAAETTPDGPFGPKKCQQRSGHEPMGMMQGCQGMGKHHPGNHCGGCWADLSPENMEKVKNERAAFYKATRDLRQEIKSKNLALKSELMKKEPNADTAMALQTEISKLRSQLDTEQLKHILTLKKIAPYANMKCLIGGKGGACMMGGKNSPFCKQ